MAGTIGDPDDFSPADTDIPQTLPTAEPDRYHPDRIRANLAYIFTTALLLLLAYLGLMAGFDRFDQMREYSEIALPALVSLAGITVGFYFRELAGHRD